MTAGTLLLRQIHPSFLQEGRVTSQAFRPPPKDQGQLSVDNADRIAASLTWQRFTRDARNSSDGVMAILSEECDMQQVPVVEHGTPYLEHCYLDFSAFKKKEIERKAKRLSSLATARGGYFRQAATRNLTGRPSSGFTAVC